MVIGSVSVIAYTKLGIGFAIYQHDMALTMNDVLVNLSYSYLAGCIFYLLTSYIPQYLRSRKLKPLVQTKLKRILNELDACKNSVFQLDGNYNNHTDEEFVQTLSNGNFNAPCALSPLQQGVTVGLYMRSKRKEILALIDEAQRFGIYMSDEQLCAITSLSTSTYFDLLNTIGIPQLDIREAVANELVNELNRIRAVIN